MEQEPPLEITIGPFPNRILHPGRLTWTIVMEVWKIIFLSKWVICRFHGVAVLWWDPNNGLSQNWVGMNSLKTHQQQGILAEMESYFTQPKRLPWNLPGIFNYFSHLFTTHLGVKSVVWGSRGNLTRWIGYPYGGALPEINVFALKQGWLEYDPFLLGFCLCSGRTVSYSHWSFRVPPPKTPQRKEGLSKMLQTRGTLRFQR